MLHSIKNTYGQASVEAAFLLPVLFVIIGLLLQPAILLYNKVIMNAASAEACRTAATIENKQSLDEFTKRRLSAIPKLNIFHAGEWQIDYSLNHEDLNAVTISHHVKTLPLLGVSASLFAQSIDSNTVLQKTKTQTILQPNWLSKSDKSIQEWIDSWQ